MGKDIISDVNVISTKTTPIISSAVGFGLANLYSEKDNIKYFLNEKINQLSDDIKDK